MALRTIIEKDDDFLRKIARKVDVIDERIYTLLDDMAETMYESDGVGLAAPQISVSRRVVVIDVGEGLMELINPVIVKQEGVQRNMEACLSVPGESGYVDRPLYVEVEALNRDGDLLLYQAEGFLAIAMCHEIDHLDGVLYIDKKLELTPEEFEELQRRDRAFLEEDEDEVEVEIDLEQTIAPQGV